MTDIRVRERDMHLCESTARFRHWECATTWPVADVLNDTFFIPMWMQCIPGDKISICRFDRNDGNDRAAKLLETVDVRVLESSREAVRLGVVGQVILFGDAKARETLTVAKGFAGKYRLMSGDTLVEEFGSKAEADAALTKRQAA